MHSQIVFFNDLLTANGWEVIETRDFSPGWLAEIWKIRSTWSPTGFAVYLSFTVDPQNRRDDFSRLDWLYASTNPPEEWSLDSGEQREPMTKQVGNV